MGPIEPQYLVHQYRDIGVQTSVIPKDVSSGLFPKLDLLGLQLAPTRALLNCLSLDLDEPDGVFLLTLHSPYSLQHAFSVSGLPGRYLCRCC